MCDAQGALRLSDERLDDVVPIVVFEHFGRAYFGGLAGVLGSLRADLLLQ